MNGDLYQAFGGEAGGPLSFPQHILTLTRPIPSPAHLTEVFRAKMHREDQGNLGSHDTFPPASCSGLKIIYFNFPSMCPD